MTSLARYGIATAEERGAEYSFGEDCLARRYSPEKDCADSSRKGDGDRRTLGFLCSGISKWINRDSLE